MENKNSILHSHENYREYKNSLPFVEPITNTFLNVFIDGKNCTKLFWNLYLCFILSNVLEVN